MRITAFTDYSLRVLMYVGSAGERHATIAEAAAALRVSENHLVKVAHALGRLGVLANVRGRGGGLRLAGPPSSINIARVVAATETLDVAECFDRDANTCALAGRCRLEGILHEAVDAFHAVLDRYTLEDLLAPPRPASFPIAWPNRKAARRGAQRKE